MSLLRRVRRGLAGPPGTHPDGLFAAQRRHFHQTVLLVRIFYGVMVLQLFGTLGKWRRWLDLESLDGLWPLAWGRGLDPALVTSLVVMLFVGGWVAVQLAPHRRFARLLAFVGIFLVAALDNSFGKIDHGSHTWIYVAGILVLLPDGTPADLSRSRAARQTYLLVFAGAQAMFLVSYSLAGLWKVVAGLEQMSIGRVGVLSPAGFSYLTADRLLQTGSESVLGPLVIEHLWLGWPLLLGGIYLELFSLLVLFRPALWRLWGLGIIALHAGSVLILTISFTSNCLLAILLLVVAPAPQYSLWATLRSLPPAKLLVWLVALVVRWGRRLLNAGKVRPAA